MKEPTDTEHFLFRTDRHQHQLKPTVIVLSETPQQQQPECDFHREQEEAQGE